MDYRKWVDAYDYVFPEKKQTTMFLIDHFGSGAICDLACATGNYSIALRKAGFDVEGFDLSEPMVKRAQDKAEKENLDVIFQQLDMMDLDFKDRYDGLFCIGNSLVHLDGVNAIKKALANVYQSLKPGGKGIIQIVNYDRILEKEVKTLPTIVSPPYTMERHYQFKDGRIIFKTVLHKDDRSHTNNVELYPLRQEELKSLLENLGFNRIRFFDGFTKKELNKEESFALVCIFEKSVSL